MARILIIDDDTAVRELMVLELERAGHEVTSAANGEVGLSLLAEEGFDVVLTDIFMPERDGLEVLRAIRKSAPAVRVVAMSGGGEVVRTSFLRAAEALGAAHILVKPVRPEDLIAAIA